MTTYNAVINVVDGPNYPGHPDAIASFDVDTLDADRVVSDWMANQPQEDIEGYVYTCTIFDVEDSGYEYCTSELWGCDS